MSGEWFKVACDFWSNPKIGDAGWPAREIYLYILSRNRMGKFDGRVPSRELFSNSIRKALDLSENQIALASEALKENGLLRLEVECHEKSRPARDAFAPCGHTPNCPTYLRIVGWGDEWRPAMTDAERKRVQRSKPIEESKSSHAKSRTSRDRVTDVTPKEEKRIDKKRSRSNPLSPPRGEEGRQLRDTTEKLVACVNEFLGRQFTARGWETSVKRVLAAGYSFAEMRAVVWWVSETWSEEIRKKIDPTSLLKLQSSQGKRTFPEYLASAREYWVTEEPNKPPPWERQPSLLPTTPEAAA